MSKLKQGWPLLIWLWPFYSCVRYDDSLNCTGECAMGWSNMIAVGSLVAIIVTAAWVIRRGGGR
jgi:hypothetical protein